MPALAMHRVFTLFVLVRVYRCYHLHRLAKEGMLGENARWHMADVVYTLEEVAKILKVSTATVRRMIEDGTLKAIRVRGQLRIRKEELDKILGQS